jgi:hypothetical protein
MEEEEEVVTAAEDPPRRQVAILLVGRSGSGKSVMCKALLEAFAPALERGQEEVVYAVNDRTRDCPYRRINWEQLPQVANCSLVVEDIIGASNREVKLLQEVLNFAQHHRQVSPVVMVAHTVTGNNIYRLIPSFHFIYISAVPSSINSLSRVLNHYGFEKEAKARHLALLKSCKEQFCHLQLDVDAGTVELTRAGQKEGLNKKEAEGRAKAAKKSALRATAERYLEDLAQPKKALLLFDHIIPKIPRGKFDAQFLTVSLRNAGGEQVVVSLIDYLAALTTPDSRADPTMEQFHAYLGKRGVHLPKVYVLNKRYWQ